MKIVWDETNELAGFAGGHALDEIPAHVIENAQDRTWLNPETAAVVMNGLRKFDEPVWLHPVTAVALTEAGLLDDFEVDCEYQGVMIRAYVGPM